MRLIDADALIGYLHTQFFYESRDRSRVYEAIQEQPTIVPEQKKGRWINYIGRNIGVDGQWLRNDGKTVFIQCDQCDSLFVRNFMNEARFCPNCGAKMEVDS